MIPEALTSAGSLVKNSTNDTLQEISQVRKKTQQEQDVQPSAETQKEIQPEELLTQIKALTDDGAYAVQFEKDKDIDELVVKIVDSETNEVIRQIPSQEIMDLTRHLDELRGNIVNTTS